MKLDKQLLSKITQKSTFEKSFSSLIEGFEEKVLAFNPVVNSFSLEKYFSGKAGQVRVTRRLIEDHIIDTNWLRQYKTKKGKIKTDFKGLYVFINDVTPIYVGISKGVIGRTLQHLKGHSHNTSTLAYNIGLLRYEILKGEKYGGIRKGFDFKSEVKPAKEFLLKQKISYLPIDNDEELYLFEIYCAMHFNCYLNKFETH